MSNRLYDGFRSLLYYKLVQSKEYSVQEIAGKMNMSSSSLYHYIEGESNFPVDLIARLYNSTHDIDFLNFILNDTDKMLTDRAESHIEKGLIEEILDVASATGEVVTKTKEAIEDGKINEAEKKKIIKTIDKAEKELEDARRCINHNRER